jgi:hypothetical protein
MSRTEGIRLKNITVVLSLFAALGSCAVCFAADPVLVTITVAGTDSSDKVQTHVTPGRTSTDCQATAISTADRKTTSSNQTKKCTTTTSPAETRTVVIPQQNVRAIMPDGSHVTLWCQAALRHCVALAAGDYQAEVKGNVAWVHVPKLDGTDDRLKYKAQGGW